VATSARALRQLRILIDIERSISIQYPVTVGCRGRPNSVQPRMRSRGAQGLHVGLRKDTRATRWEHGEYHCRREAKAGASTFCLPTLLHCGSARAAFVSSFFTQEWLEVSGSPHVCMAFPSYQGPCPSIVNTSSFTVNEAQRFAERCSVQYACK